MPVSIAQALAGKNIAAVLFIVIEMLGVTLASLVLRIAIAPGKVVEAFVVTAIVGVYLLAIGNMASVHFPARNESRACFAGRRRQPDAGVDFSFLSHRAAARVSRVLGAVCFGSQLIFVVIMGFAAALGAVVYWIAMESAVGTAVERREKILMELSRK